LAWCLYLLSAGTCLGYLLQTPCCNI
jgi:hypothetical protein